MRIPTTTWNRSARAPAAPSAHPARAGASCSPGNCWRRHIPELLSQTGTTGRQFAHLLIRSYQEMSRNDFPDLERSAEKVGERRFPLRSTT